MNSEDRIEREILLKAPIRRVWRALEDAGEFGEWFGAALIGEKFIAGNRVRGQITFPGYEHLVFEVLVEEVEPERKLSFRWHPYAVDPAVDYGREPMTLVVFTLQAVEHGTLLRLVESGFDGIPAGRRQEAYRMHSSGWDEQMMNIEKHVAVPAIADRFRGAIWGAFIGDAFCLGSHWIYNLEDLARRFPGGVTGFEAPAEGHYHYGKRSGDLTHYGDAALLLLQSVAERGGFDPVDFGGRFVALFGSDAYRGYRDHATRDTLESYNVFAAANPGAPYHFQGGGGDDQPATVTRLAPVVVAHLRDNDLPRVVANVTRVCQNNDRAVAYAGGYALVLAELFSGSGMESAVGTAGRALSTEVCGSEVSEAIGAAGNTVSLTVLEATLKFGQSCPLANSFPAAVQCALKYENDFGRAITETAGAGGDNAGRAAMIGAWLGAVNGVAGIPAAWRERLNKREEINALIERVVTRAA